MYNSGVEIPKIDFNLINFSNIAPGSYFLGFDLNDSGKLKKIDSSGTCTVVEGVGTVTGISCEVLTSDGSNGATGQSALTFDGTTLTVNTVEMGLGGGSLPSNLSVGYQALRSNSTGARNIAIGKYSLYNNTTGCFNTAIGNYSLRNNNASFNTAIGYGTLLSNTTGVGNTGLGNRSLYNNTSGTGNVSIGADSLLCNTYGINGSGVFLPY